jgi:hypothetical protein
MPARHGAADIVLTTFGPEVNLLERFTDAARYPIGCAIASAPAAEAGQRSKLWRVDKDFNKEESAGMAIERLRGCSSS